MSRSQWRGIAFVFLFGFASYLIYIGLQGWVVNRLLPAHYLGFFLVAYGVAGLFGVNIWRGGPLDPRNDPPEYSNRHEQQE
jgi:hypothetical protein